ncbi:hypothetical protein BN59_01267 [Legionella massiliensis]|uniref:Uncharacterized protein n=1 Tax=Legionella massiliensis TaxID=1034943 RepID=A0A078KZ48_9GAMM|nr:hypothetical protein [Legionella massiliensis]CDZ76988.1 hypothetical protein BN59_01267 [Legionella massiliensis]CEE12726.1 hypothetical protein BN1094_01267 [Legionella massiliensis]
MSAIELIRKRLQERGINAEVPNRVIGFMILERTGYFDFPEYHLDTAFNPGLIRASFEIRPAQTGVSSPEIARQLYNSQVRVMDYFDSASSQYRFPNQTGFYFHISNEEVEEAVVNSSFYLALGDLSQLSLRELIKIEDNLELYRNYFNQHVASALQHNVRAFIQQNFTKVQVRQARAYAEKEDELRNAMLQQEYRFDEAFVRLDKKVSELMLKAAELTFIGDSSQKNDDFRLGYERVASLANDLSTNLSEERRTFFRINPNLPGLRLFRIRCEHYIDVVEEEFAKYRQAGVWYDELHPIVRGLLDCCRALAGVVAALTVVPAVLVEIYAPHGFLGTFFQRPKTDSLKKLESFEHDILGEGGVIDELKRVVAPRR